MKHDPAFPIIGHHFIENGLSKREYAAIHILDALANSGFKPKYSATLAIEFADALFSELNKNQ